MMLQIVLISLHCIQGKINSISFEVVQNPIKYQVINFSGRRGMFTAQHERYVYKVSKKNLLQSIRILHKSLL